MKTKRCFKCRTVKPLDGFYAHSRMRDGHLNKCIECTKRDVRNHYDLTRVARSEYEKRRAATFERKEARVDYQKAYRLRHPERYRARVAVQNALRTGLLKRSGCEACGSFPAQAHHEDYSRPLDVRWLCFSCHRAEHGQVVVAEAS